MKSLLFSIATLFAISSHAQINEGKIIYERRLNVHKNLPPEAEQFKAFTPEFQTSKMELAFKGQQSLYQPSKAEEDELPSTDQGGGNVGGGGFRAFRFGAGAEGISFKDYEKDIKTDIRELGPSKYLLDDSLTHYSWKLAPDTMTILGHLCHKATTNIKGGVLGAALQRFGGGRRAGGNGANNNGDSSRRVRVEPKDQPAVAWYADDIASPSGPDNFGGLPGLILKLDIDEGALVFTPLSFEEKAGTVKAPSNGKKITREEYRALAEQQFGAGGGRRGGGGGNQAIIRQ